MASIRADGVDLNALLHDLSRGEHSLGTRIHHDPELLNHRGEVHNWRPSFGQTGSAQGHSAKQA